MNFVSVQILTNTVKILYIKIFRIPVALEVPEIFAKKFLMLFTIHKKNLVFLNFKTCTIGTMKVKIFLFYEADIPFIAEKFESD